MNILFMLAVMNFAILSILAVPVGQKRSGENDEIMTRLVGLKNGIEYIEVVEIFRSTIVDYTNIGKIKTETEVAYVYMPSPTPSVRTIPGYGHSNHFDNYGSRII